MMNDTTRSSGANNGSKAWQRWLPALFDDDEVNKSVAAEALGESNDPEAILPLLAAMEPSRGMIAGGGVVARELVRLREVWTVELFIKTLTDDRDFVRRASAEALGWLKDKDAVPALIGALQDGEVGVRIEASWALGEIGSLEAVKPLVGLLEDVDANVRRSVADALGALADPSARAALQAALSDDDGGVRAAAAGALRHLSAEAG